MQVKQTGNKKGWYRLLLLATGATKQNKTKRLGWQTHLVLGSFSFPLAARYSWSFLHLSSAKCGHERTTET